MSGAKSGYRRPRSGELYYTLLLKDLGCSSNASRICELYLADDRGLKRDFKLVNGSLGQVLRFVVSHAGADAPVAKRFRAVLDQLQNGKEYRSGSHRDTLPPGCGHRAPDAFFRRGGIRAFSDLDEHWNGEGNPLGLKGMEIPVYSQIALMAQVADVFNATGDPEFALREIRQRSGTWFDPELVAAFERVASTAGVLGWTSQATT